MAHYQWKIVLVVILIHRIHVSAKALLVKRGRKLCKENNKPCL